MKSGWKVLCKIYGVESARYVSAGIHTACVEYKPSRSTHVWDRADEIRGGWRHRRLSLISLPEGTRLANRVRILEGELA